MMLHSIDPSELGTVSASLRACLDFTGRLEAGGHVTLTIVRDGQTEKRLTLPLPPLPELNDETRQHWQTYRQLAHDREQAARLHLVEVFYEKTYNERLQDCHASADRLLVRFQRWLESAEMQQVTQQLRTHLSPRDRARLSIAATDRQIERLPWQKWALLDDYPHLEPSLSFPELSRCPPSAARDRSAARILAVFGNDDGIETAVDRQLLTQAAIGTEDGSLDIEFAIAPTRARLEAELHDGDWDILFFAGHSRTEADSGRIFINATDSVTVDELWFSLQKAVDRGLRLAIFNSCDGLGIARALNAARIPQMAIMREAVPDRVAQEFLRYFLQAFARDRLPLAEAVRYARQRLAHLEADHPCATWLPALYQHPEADVLTWERLVSVCPPDAIPPDCSEVKANNSSGGIFERFQEGVPGEKTGRDSEAQTGDRFDSEAPKPYRRSRRVWGSIAIGVTAIAWIASAAIADRIGRRAFAANNHTLAIRAFEVQVLLRPFAALPRYNLAQIYDRKYRDPDRALVLMRAAALRGFVLAHPEWARLLLDRGDLDRAEIAIAEGFDILPPDRPNAREVRASLHSQAAWLWLQRQQFDVADRHASDAIALFPESSAKAWCVRARVRAARGEDAREAWTQTIAQADPRFVSQQACQAEGKAYLHSLPSFSENREL